MDQPSPTIDTNLDSFNRKYLLIGLRIFEDHVSRSKLVWAWELDRPEVYIDSQIVAKPALPEIFLIALIPRSDTKNAVANNANYGSQC